MIGYKGKSHRCVRQSMESNDKRGGVAVSLVTPRKVCIQTVKKSTSAASLVSGSTRRRTTRGEPRGLISRRSISYENISPALKTNVWLRRKQLFNMTEPETSKEIENDPQQLSVDYKHLNKIYRVYVNFLKNAWRSSKKRHIDLQQQFAEVDKQNASLKIQTNSLKAIVHSDDQVMFVYSKELQKLKTSESQLLAEKEQLHKEKLTMEKMINNLQDVIEALKTDIINEKNTCQFAKSEMSALEAQLTKEREKIAKLKASIKEAESKVYAFQKEKSHSDYCIRSMEKSLENAKNEINSKDLQCKSENENFRRSEEAAKDLERKLKAMKKELDLAQVNNKWLSNQTKNLKDDIQQKIKERATLDSFIQQTIMDLTISELNSSKKFLSTWSQSLTHLSTSFIKFLGQTVTNNDHLIWV